MSDLSNRIVQKLWSYHNVLRDDGLSYQDYLEQRTCILFLKMADERATITGEAQAIPKGYRWSDLAKTPPTCRTLTSWPRRSPRICETRWVRSRASWRT
jgi:hypothetical protein